MTKKVEIRTRMSDGRLEWAGTGTIDEYGNIECAAVIPADVYDSIESAISSGETEGKIGADGEEYSWELRRESE